MAATSVDEVVFLERGLKLVKNLKFNAQMQVQSVIHTGDSLTVCHNSCTNDNYLIRYPLVKLPQDKRPPRYNMPVPINKLLYINEVMMYIAFCVDFRLRVYNQDYELLTTLALSFNVTCTCFDDDNNVLYAGGMGHLNSWNLQTEGYNILQPNPPMKFSLLDREQIVSLSLCHHAPLLCVTCIHGIYLLNTQTREEQHFISNVRNAALICATVYSPLKYVIAARDDGTIKIMSYTKNKEKVLHRQYNTSTITSLFVHPDSPFLISSCLDGTIRFWNILTLTQTLLHDLKSPIPSVSLTSTRQLLCFSFSNIFLLDINQIVELLSITHSEVTSLRVTEHRNSQRIVALTGNGCIRVVLPHSGKFRTVLLPILATRMLQEVLYNMADDVLYLLLKTGEILVYNTKTKPCTPIEMWAPSNPQQEVSCFDMVKSTVGNIIFGGLRSGFLCILHANDCLIALPCPAHDEAVIAIASSNSKHLYRKNPAINVITYANSGLYHVWTVEIKTDISNRLIIHDVIILNLNVHPVHMKLLDTKLCITTSINQILMYNVPIKDTTLTVAIASPRPLNQSPINHHYDRITSLAHSQTLQLFGTSSKDGRIKIWDSQCRLISDINLKSSVTCISFNDFTHDLLVGFQNQLYVISASRYLPKWIHESHKVIDTMIEYPIPFQPKLKFWFDCNTVPILPLLPHARNNTVDYIPTPNPYTLRLISQNTQQDNSEGLGIDPDNPNITQQYSLDDFINDTTSSTNIKSYSSMGTIPFNRSDTIVSLSQRRNSNNGRNMYYNNRGMGGYNRNKAASVAPVHNPSAAYPVAPDGFIPNSVVRAKVAENQPVDHVLQRVLIRQYKALEQQRNTTAKRKRIRKFLVDLKFFTDEEIGPLINNNKIQIEESEKEVKEEDTKSDEEIEKIKEKFDYTIPQWLPYESLPDYQKPSRVRTLLKTSSRAKYQRTGSPPEPLPDLPTYSCNINVGKEDEEHEEYQSMRKTPAYSRTGDRDSSYLATKTIAFSAGLQNNTMSRPFSYGTKKVVGLKFGYKPKTPNFNESGRSLQHSQSAIIYREHKMGQTIKNSPSTPFICFGLKPKIEDEVFDMTLNLRLQDDERDDLESTLKSIADKPWFPLSSIAKQDSNESLDWMIDMLMNSLDEAEPSTFKEIGEALVMLHAKNYFSEDLKKETGQKILEKYLENPLLQDEMLDLMIKIGYRADHDTLMTILPTLVNENTKVKEAGFKALQKLTGVTDRSGLHKLLIDEKFLQHVQMNEDEDIHEVETRLESSHPPELPLYHKRYSTQHEEFSNKAERIGFRVISYVSSPVWRQPYYTHRHNDSDISHMTSPLATLPSEHRPHTLTPVTPAPQPMTPPTPGTITPKVMTPPISANKTPPTSRYTTPPSRGQTPKYNVKKAIRIKGFGERNERPHTNYINIPSSPQNNVPIQPDKVTTSRSTSKFEYIKYMKLSRNKPHPPQDKPKDSGKTSRPVSIETGDHTLAVMGTNQLKSTQIKNHKKSPKLPIENLVPQSKQLAPLSSIMTTPAGHLATPTSHPPNEYFAPPTSHLAPPNDQIATPTIAKTTNQRYTIHDGMQFDETFLEDHMITPISHMTPLDEEIDEITSSHATLLNYSSNLPFSFLSTLSKSTPEHSQDEQILTTGQYELHPSIKLPPLILTQKILQLQQATPNFSQTTTAQEHILKCNPYNLTSLSKGKNDPSTKIDNINNDAINTQNVSKYFTEPQDKSEEHCNYMYLNKIPPMRTSLTKQQDLTMCSNVLPTKMRNACIIEQHDKCNTNTICNESLTTKKLTCPLGKNKMAADKTTKFESELLFVWSDIRPLLLNEPHPSTDKFESNIKLPKIIIE